jgi:putative glutathione S-transferase
MDPFHKEVKFVRDLYDHVGSNTAVYSVPILWDTKTDTLVNNESSDIIRMLDNEMD